MAPPKMKPNKTPVRQALLDTSQLMEHVSDGLAALDRAHRSYIANEIHGTFGDSLNLDEALLETHPNANRWDYLLGHTPSQQVIGVEPHTAKDDEVSTLIAKRAAAKEQLASHLEPGSRVAKWIWVASGKVQFADTEKARRRLDENGIEFIGKQLQARHLPATASTKGKRR